MKNFMDKEVFRKEAFKQKKEPLQEQLFKRYLVIILLPVPGLLQQTCS